MMALLTLSALLTGQAAAPPPPPPEVRREMRVVTLDGPGERAAPSRDMDKDNDGFVSRDEIVGTTASAFRILDADNDGRISPDELAAGRAAAHVILGGPGGPGGPREIHIVRHGPVGGPDSDGFDMDGPQGGPGDLDIDHNGKVSEAEFLAPLRAALQRLDADHSGALEAGEHGEGADVRVITRHGTPNG